MNKLAKFKPNISSRIILATLICSGILSLFLALQPDLQTKGLKISNPTPIPSASVQEILEKSTPKPTSKPIIYTPSPAPKNESTPQPTASPNNSLQASENAVSENKINVSITGISRFDLSIAQGANHCDVLSQALSQGKISSLNMKYDDNLKTYAIYQINGLGKENSVWWVYEVNGQSPSQGCSYIKVNNGDKIEWKYIGS